jgi:hypothetical protein
MGDTETRRKNKIMEDEELREFVRHRNICQEPTPERNFNPPAKP